MKKTLLVLTCAVVLLTMLACNIPMPTPTVEPLPVPPPTDLPVVTPFGPPGWLTYTDTYNGFSIMYPPDGTLFLEAMVRIDLPRAPDTNLGEKYLQIEFGPDATPCTSPLGAGWEPGSIAQTPVTFNGTDFIMEQGADAGAGNIYEWQAYSVSNGSICISLDFILHSSNILFYDTPPAEFDPLAEAEVFTQMMETFQWLP